MKHPPSVPAVAEDEETAEEEEAGKTSVAVNNEE